MDRLDPRQAFATSRRRFLAAAGIAGATSPLWAQGLVDLALPGGPSARPLTTAFPQKGEMILQRSRPPLLETPFSVFDKGVFTPNDRFFVRWHWSQIPTAIDVDAFRLKVRGAVTREIAMSIADLLKMPRVEIAAVNQCSGNSRGLFQPRVPGGQWRHGAMGNAKWTGVRLRDVLDRAGVRAGAVAVRFGGLDRPVVADGPDFLKSLSLDHARSDEVIIAFAMNGAPLPLLNGFPLRLVVPGWFSTYWIKMLDDIELLTAPDDNYWMAKAYRIPATAGANVMPGAKGFETVPIGAMAPRSWITSHADGGRAKAGAPIALRGIAMGGDRGVARVDVSADGGARWTPAELGPDAGRYSFRRFEATLGVRPPGATTLMARCTNDAGIAQPMTANWNPGGYLRCVVEPVPITVA